MYFGMTLIGVTGNSLPYIVGHRCVRMGLGGMTPIVEIGNSLLYRVSDW